jgi:Big-like domain-containing protein
MASSHFLRSFVIPLAVLTVWGCGASQLTIPADPTNGGDGPGSAGGGSTAARIEPVEGDSQIAAAGTDVAVPPAIRVTDANGQPVAGYEVTFVVTRGGGALLNPSQTTGSDGIARVGAWTLGSPGPNTLEARAGSLSGSPVVFHETAMSRTEVDHFVFLVQPKGVRVNESQTLRVAMVDVAGNVVPLSGIEIYLGLFRRGNDDRYSAHNDLLLGERFANTENGVASFQLKVKKVGTYQFRALSDDLPEVGPHGPEPFLFSRPFNVY